MGKIKNELGIWFHNFMVQSYENSFDLLTEQQKHMLIQQFHFMPHIGKLPFDKLIEQNKEFDKRFKYKNDHWFGLKNRIQDPFTAHFMGHGDCDDFASAMIYLMYGYETYLFTYYCTNPFKAHTVVLFKHDGKLMCMDYKLITQAANGKIDDIIAGIEKYRKVKIIASELAVWNWNELKYQPVERGDVEKVVS